MLIAFDSYQNKVIWENNTFRWGDGGEFRRG